MKQKYFTGILALCCLASCAGNGNSTVKDDKVIDSSLLPKNSLGTILPGKLINKIVCKEDASQSYALYIPASGNTHPLPVVYFFDSHGDGAYPLGKYKALADSFDYILAGSNNSKNGNDMATGETIWNVLLADTKSRLNINTNLIYVCGFSGGAKVASYLALHDADIKGVIANGAALPDIAAAGNSTFTFTAIAGEGDMNMTDLVSINNSLDHTAINHRIIFFDGIHEWAPESTMAVAFAGCKLDAIRDKTIATDTAFINDFVVVNQKNINDLLQKNNYIKAERICTLATKMLTGVSEYTSWFMQKDAAIKTSAVYNDQLQKSESLFTKEENIKNVFNQQFQQGNKDYWIKTINDIIAKSKLQNDESPMYQRLHAYLSLAFYSITNQQVNAAQNENAAYFDELYKLSDPANSEAWYLSAILDARNNDTAATQRDLTKAISSGFADRKRLMQQQEFQGMASQIHLEDISATIR